MISLVENPRLLQTSHFQKDLIERAKEFLEATNNSIGAYTHTKGIPLVRAHIADFIERRDGFAADPENIFMTNGASTAISMVLNLIVSDENVGVLLPIPQYPLYSATLSLLNAKTVSYYLSEEDSWDMNVEMIVTSFN